MTMITITHTYDHDHDHDHDDCSEYNLLREPNLCRLLFRICMAMNLGAHTGSDGNSSHAAPAPTLYGLLLAISRQGSRPRLVFLCPCRRHDCNIR
jgi:hypothetical protein